MCSFSYFAKAIQLLEIENVVKWNLIYVFYMERYRMFARRRFIK